ncbi:hypothetical protein [Bacillus sp. N1-1]|jgi:C4-dicarboxylate-specific signal transduction histidine kinase|uniref:hypothetical protein n=1 Tax=Bacillus sp. N1-1 TaxID=2682541 RepID=UPI001318273F|nr:hypothetical protein [Bacillus sp. N1-1]QHA91113.1 hypothetical protein GNK04_06595 [Bacillus sp. N1-1]
MDFDFDWWNDYWERQRQKDALRTQIKSDLEAEANLLNTHLEHCYAVGSLSERHKGILNQIEHNFDGQANKALVQRFEENELKLIKMKMMYEMLHDSIRVR